MTGQYLGGIVKKTLNWLNSKIDLIAGFFGVNRHVFNLFSVSTVLILSCLIVFSSINSANGQEIPNFKGLTVGDAQTVGRDNNLMITFSFVDSNEPAGTVVGQKPEVGSKIERGSRVTVILSKGKKSRSETTPEPSLSSSDDPSPISEPSKPSPNSGQQPAIKGLTEQQRKDQLAKIRAESDAKFQAEMAERTRKFNEQQAEIAAEQQRITTLSNNLDSANSLVYQARSNLQYWQNQINDFAARGMIQSGAGAQAIASYNQAQNELDNAIQLQSEAQAAWDSR